MGLFKKRPAQQPTAAPTEAESLEKLVETAGRPSLFAHSEFVKQADCPGAAPGSGRKLDIAGGETPCQNGGAPLSFPVGTSALECPYCHTGTHRV
jgi:hypothetical protein